MLHSLGQTLDHFSELTTAVLKGNHPLYLLIHALISCFLVTCACCSWEMLGFNPKDALQFKNSFYVTYYVQKFFHLQG